MGEIAKSPLRGLTLKAYLFLFMIVLSYESEKISKSRYADTEIKLL